ncbi:MAG TPA: diguanylate cyclase [Catenuloplanes sp.]|jgi:diguanylate cyclase (GGDEF)-like protein
MSSHVAGGAVGIDNSAARDLQDRLRRRRALGKDPVCWAGAVLGLGWLVGYAVLIVLGGESTGLRRLVSDGAYLVPIIAAATIGIRAARRAQGPARAMWRILAVANTAWLVAELVRFGYPLLGDGGRPPFPSWVDALSLTAVSLAIPAILLGFRHAGSLRQVRGLLDAGLIVTAIAAVGWHLLIAPRLSGPADPGVFVTAAYPLLDLVLLACLVSVGVAGHRMVPYSVLLVGLAYCFAAASGAMLNYLVATGQPGNSGWGSLGWQAQAVLLCLAALVSLRHHEDPATVQKLDRGFTVLPVLLAAAASVSLVLVDRSATGAVQSSTLILSGVLLGGLLLRQVLFGWDRDRRTRHLQSALDQQEKAAVTDGLTTLYNRRFLLEMLKLEADRSSRAQRPLSLAVIDLDHFKRVNDTHGHPVGDLVLVQAANQIRQVSRSSDIVARYGGEEFVILLPDTDETEAFELGERIRRALHRTPLRSPRGDDIRMTGSVGVATARVDPGTGMLNTERLVAEADRALYQAKAQGRDRTIVAGRLNADEGASTVALPYALLWIADRIDSALGSHEHSTAVERWTRLLGRRLGLNGAALGRLAAAGRLHDIGKATVDEAILRKAGQLEPEEWDQLRCHCEEGGRLLRDLGHSDLAPLVEAHHERYDGSGYPHGMAGRTIPFESRIIAVCDSWAAMRVNRAYATAKTVAEARREIEKGRGTQFDPEIADAFLALVNAGLIDEPRPLSNAPEDAPVEVAPDHGLTHAA